MLYKLVTALLLLTTHQLLLVQGASTQDAPPVITAIKPVEIDDPGSYIVVAEDDVSRENKLECIATNADQVYWKYKSTLKSEYTDLPSVMTQLPQQNGVETIRVVTDQGNQYSNDRYLLNGYYQCFAVSNYLGNEYVALRPFIHLLYPDIKEEKRIGSVDALQLYGTATSGRPYRLPCIRNPDLGMGGFLLNPPDAANLEQAKVTFSWGVRDYTTNVLTPLDLNSAHYQGRVRMDPRTGDLYFAVLANKDGKPPAPQDQAKAPAYQCSVLIGNRNTAVVTNELYLTVSVNNNPSADPALVVQYPATNEEKEKGVSCVEKTHCRLTAIFGGKDSVNQTADVIAPPTSSVVYTTQSYGVSFDSGTPDETGGWVFKMTNSQGSTEAVTVQVKVQAFPVLISRDGFPAELTKYTGQDVTYVCDPEYTDSYGLSFYINGIEVTNTEPSYVTYERTQPTLLTIKNLQRNHSASIACVATNDAGTMFELSDLTVYDEPVADLHPREGYEIKGENSTSGLIFNCSFKLDAKTNKVELWWRSNRTENGDVLIKGKDDYGVQGVKTTAYDATTNTIRSELTIQADSRTQGYIENTQWWCVCKYQILDKEVTNAKTNVGLLLVDEAVNTTTPAPVVMFQYTYVILGAVLGFLFLILLIVLINCYVQKNKGEQYRVDENERKAGHIPEEEMKAYGYVDYTRPNTDTMYSHS